MAMELHRSGFPGIAASTINAGAAVGLAASAVERQFVPIATLNVEPFGIALATAAQAGASVANQPALTSGVPIMDLTNVVKVTAGGSLGANADVGVASTNGTLGPVVGVAGSVIWRVGKAVSPAAAGEVFSLYVSPRQLSGTP